MNVLIIGSGGREHALAWKAAQSPRVETVFVAPGNAGTATEPGVENVAIDVMDFAALADFAAAQRRRADHRRPGGAAGGAAWWTTSKRAACAASDRAGAPPSWRAPRPSPRISWPATTSPPAPTRNFTELEPALAYLRDRGAPIVVKADGLAAGKGVIVAETLARGGSGGHRHAVRQRLRRGRLPGGDRGVPRGRGGQLYRDGGRQQRAAHGHQPGPQAHRRGRHRPQYRRHGRLLAGPGGG